MRTKHPHKRSHKEKRNVGRRPGSQTRRTGRIRKPKDPEEYYNMPKEQLILFLTQQQKIFCYEYIKDFKVYQAYRRAGYTSKSRSPATLLRSKPQVDALIELLVEEKRQSIEVEADQILKELGYIGFSDMADFCTWKNSRVVLKRSDQLTYEQTRCVSAIQETKYGVKITLHSKLNALRMMGEYLDMFSGDASDNKTPREKAKEIKDAFDNLMGSVPTKPPKRKAA